METVDKVAGQTFKCLLGNSAYTYRQRTDDWIRATIVRIHNF